MKDESERWREKDTHKSQRCNKYRSLFQNKSAREPYSFACACDVEGETERQRERDGERERERKRKR